MTDRSPVLDYAPPPARWPLASLLTPKNIATAGAVVALASLIVPFDIGSGRVIVNPLRFLGRVVAVACAVLYALLRVWRDPGGGVPKRVAFALCLVVAVLSFVMAHLSVWGRTRLPPFEMRFEYWRWIAVMSGAVTIACIFSAVSAVVRLWRRVGTVRPAS